MCPRGRELVVNSSPDPAGHSLHLGAHVKCERRQTAGLFGLLRKGFSFYALFIFEPHVQPD
jgi:hypothetical protein